jgi:tetratricopeptide (TPR) repeat protein
MLRICAIALAAGLIFPVFADENLFEKGLAAYQNKQYAEARDDFQKLVEKNTVSAALLHNLALAYFQLDQAPMSLALWRKALTIEPGFRPARAGRDFAEMKLQARGFERDRISESIQRNLEFISFFESLWLIALVTGAAGWLWIRYVADRRHALDEESPLPPFPATAVALSVVLAACIGLSLMKLSVSLKTRATVIAKKASARSLPTEEGVALFELNGGSEVLIRRRDKDWSQVQNSEGSSGWVANSELFITSQR